MSLIRFALTLLIGIATPVAATAQNFEEPRPVIRNGYHLETGSVGYIQSVIDSLDLDSKTDKQTGGHHVVTNLAEHPVHAMRRRKAAFKDREEGRSAVSPEPLIDAATEIGLHGRWFVLSGKKDGLLSEAQIGQQPGDVISILPEENIRGLLPMG